MNERSRSRVQKNNMTMEGAKREKVDDGPLRNPLHSEHCGILTE